MEIKRTIKGHLLVLTFGVILINIGLTTFFIDKLNQPIYQNLLTDVSIMLIAGLTGISLAKKLNFPLWWTRDIEKGIWKQLFTVTTLGLLIIITNTLLYYYDYINNYNSVSSSLWTQFSNLKEVILLSLRAGITEEIVFRLFMFTFATYIVRRIIHRNSLSIGFGIIISSYSFTLLHGGFNIIIFSYGIILAYLYYRNGILPAITVHFLANVIPWTLLFCFWN